MVQLYYQNKRKDLPQMEFKDDLKNKAKDIADAGLKKADEIYRISKLKLNKL